MTRIFGPSDDGVAVEIDCASVEQFFETRAERIAELGPTRAVIYQDKHPDLAERRDTAERERMLPQLRLDGSQSLLDVGCGTGRWVPTLAPLVARYHGIDLTPGLVKWASGHHVAPHVRFSVAAVDSFTLAQLEDAPFDRILCAGVLIYLNDSALGRALSCIRSATDQQGSLVLFREPVAQTDRLTVVDHDSEELEQVYNAIYRTRTELLDAFEIELGGHGWTLAGCGFVFDDPDLNNRAETRQEWFLWQFGSVT